MPQNRQILGILPEAPWWLHKLARPLHLLVAEELIVGHDAKGGHSDLGLREVVDQRPFLVGEAVCADIAPAWSELLHMSHCTEPSSL